MATTIMSMATRSSDLEDQMSGANLQTEGHVGVQSQCQKGPEEMGALGSSPSHSPSWSLARRLPPNHPNTRYCLGIHVTLTEETGAVPHIIPCLDSAFSGRYAPCYARTGLTKAMVTGPGRAVLFYGRHSFGEGLSPDESRDAAFMLTGAGMWVGKPAYLATDPLTIQEGWWEIAQAVTKCQIKARGPGNPLSSQCSDLMNQRCQPHNHSDLTDRGDSPQKDIPLKRCQFRPSTSKLSPCSLANQPNTFPRGN